MSQKNPPDGGQKGFAVGRGLLAAAETLNFSMSEQQSGPQGRAMGNMVSGMGLGNSGVESQDRNSQMARRGGGGSHLGSTMKLFASLGLSPADLDALAQIPEENISVETLPHILMQLKNRKGTSGDRHMAVRDLPSMSPENPYRGGREDWDDMHGGRMGGPSMGQSSARGPSQASYGSMQSGHSSRGYDLGYSGNNNGGGGGGGGGGGRDGQYSALSCRDPYEGLGMGSSQNDGLFMQRRMGSPSQGKVQDFLGARPPMYPHVCALCDFDVHSNMEWNQHTNGLRHAENRKLLLQMYPDWDPGMDQNTSVAGSHQMEMPNLSAGLLGPVPFGQGQSAGNKPSRWGGGPGSGFSNKGVPHPGPSKILSRVVVAKYDRKPLSRSLMALTEPFGTLREHLVLKNKAFLEMDSHEEAMDMVNYYKRNTANLNGILLHFYLSKDLLAIEKKNRGVAPRARSPREVKGQGSQVVFFSNLHREEEKKMELLTIAGRFGTVEKHLFLNEEAFVQLGTQEDAEMMVKYYTVNRLTIRGRPIRLNICTKYKTLSVNPRGGQAYRGDSQARRGEGDTSPPKSSSTKAATTSSKVKEDKKKKKPEAKLQTAEKKKKVEEKEEAAEVLEGEKGAEVAEEEEPSKEQEQKNLKKRKVEELEEQWSDLEEEDQKGEGDEELKPPPTEVHKASGEALPDPAGAPESTDLLEEEKETGEEKGKGRELEGQSGPEDLESREDAPAENSDLAEEDLPEDMEGVMEDFPENMEDFVTLDELAEDEDDHSEESDSIDNSRKGGMRVVNLVGFRRGYGFLEELLALAKPFGDVVKHLVLDLRPEAYLQFASEEEAKAMARFYNSNVTATVCGKPVRISHSQTYPTIQCGASKVVYIGQLPHTRYKEEDVLKLAEPFGRLRRYFLNRIRRECFVEMENANDAEKMWDFYKKNPAKMQNKRLSVYVSRKYKQLKYGHAWPQQEAVKRAAKREESPCISTSSIKTSKNTEEPPAKKPKSNAPEEQEQEVEEEEEEEAAGRLEENSAEKLAEPTQTHAAAEPPTPAPGPQEEGGAKEMPDHQKVADVKNEEVEQEPGTPASQTETPCPDLQPPTGPKPPSATLPLAPYTPGTPLGVEYVKMGYYCRVCFLFYSNEDTAKKVHCSSQTHYEKLKKHLEKEQAKAQNPKKGKKME